METNKPTKISQASEIGALREIFDWNEKSPRTYIEQNLWIKNKAGGLQLLKFNTPQEIIYSHIQKIKSKGKPIRIILLKARREGASTLAEGLIFERTARYENTHSLIVAHEPESTEEIFAMSKLFYDMLLPDEKPMKRYDNKKQLAFENPDEKTRYKNPGLRSKMVIATADKVKIGRGLNIHCFHASEIAHWKDAKTLMLAAMQAIPDLPNTAVIIESTANGIAGRGKYFFDLVNDALAGKSEFEVIFLPWFLMPEYSRPFESESEKEKFAKTLDDYEKNLTADHDLAPEQLNWRRWAIENKCGGSVEDFKQEYPATIQEAFIATSKLVIPKELIEAQRKFIRTPIRFFDDNVAIYEEPARGHFYSLGADSAEGEGGDDGALTVIDRMTGREVASFADDRIPPEDLATKALKVAMLFNNSFIVPELNHPGPAMLAVLKNSGYPNVYRREVTDTITNTKTRKLGWRTTSSSKPMMVQDFKRALREEELGLSSEATVNQMFTFVRTDEPGKHGMGAENGDGVPKEKRNKDDRLISAMLAWQGMKELPAK